MQNTDGCTYMHTLIECTLHKRNFVFATELKSVKLTSESETFARKELTLSYNRSSRTANA